MTKLSRYGGVAGLVVLTTLAACGGGGGDGGGTTPPPNNPPPGGGTTNVAPAITTQPASQTVTAGGNATFTVVATGTPAPTYEWRKNGAIIPGATSASYTLSNATTADSGAKFTVVVTNAAGSVTSAEATLTVNAAATGAPSGITLPATTFTAVAGSSPTVTVAVAGGTPPFTYKWQSAPSGSTTFTDIAGQTTATLTVANIPASANGTQYRVAVTNSVTTVNSPVVSVNVLTPGISIAAGSTGPKGSVDGTGTAARFAFPANIATDAAGNVYVADFGNQTIRQITPAGAVVTLAGREYTQGNVNAVGADARFNNPVGITVIGGTLYVADQSNNAIRIVDVASRNVATLALTDLNGGTSPLSAPTSVRAATATTLYVADYGNNRIRRIDITGPGTANISTVAGAAGPGAATDGPVATARFSSPADIAVNPGGPGVTDDVIYVADSFNNTIRRVDSANVTTIAGVAGAFGGANGSLTTARLGSPRAITLVGTTDLYVTESGNHIIRRINLALPTTDANYITTLAGTAEQVGALAGTGAAARFNMPYGIAAFGTNLYVSNFGNDTINRINLTNAVVEVFAGDPGARGSVDGAAAVARFSYPRGIATDANGVTYLADSLNNSIRRIAADGATTTWAGLPARTGGFEDGPGTGAGAAARFNDPRSVAVDAQGNVYVADRSNNAIRRIANNATHDVTTVADFAKGVDRPDAITVGPNGMIYVASTGANTILRIDPNVPATGANTTVIAGAANQAGYVDGPGTTARFNFPNGVAATATTLYVADNFNYRIRAIDLATNTVTTIAGTGVYGYANGAGNVAQFRSPGPMVVNSTGTHLYMVDYLSNTLRRIQLTAPYTVSLVAGADSQYKVQTGALPGQLNGPTGVSLMPGISAGARVRVSDGLEHVLLDVITP